MNTLGSWIDQEAFAGVAKDIAPAAADAAPWYAEAATPVTRLMADDFKLPEHFSPAPFPGPPASMAAPERQKVRHFLDNIRHKAEQSGLIPKNGTDNAQVPAAVPDLPPWGAPLTPPALADLSAIPPRRHVPHFEVPLGPLTTRLRALTDWIRRQIDSADIFIIDAQGCPVSDREASGEIVAGAVLLAEAARRAAPHLPSAAEGAIYLDLQDGK